MKNGLKRISSTNFRISVVIPSYKVTRHILDVISAIPPIVWRIYVIDDACPHGSGRLVEMNALDPRVRVVYHQHNKGVGAAVMTGYRTALADHADVIVKVDGDGQMDPKLIPYFIEPILTGTADYTKGNRFYNLEEIQSMPTARLLGNAALSFLAKLSTGYWNLFDPTNGYTAIHADVAKHLPLEKISRRYFFETDILFRLNTLRAVVIDVPMHAKYDDEVSNLKIKTIVIEFFRKHARNFLKRIFYNYFLRDLSLASIELVIGTIMFTFGICYGSYSWEMAAVNGVVTPPGTVMLSALPIMLGVQFIMGFLAYDIASIPTSAIHNRIKSLSISNHCFSEKSDR